MSQYLPTVKRLGSLQLDLVQALRKEYLRVIEEASSLHKRASMSTETWPEYDTCINTYADGFYAPIASAMARGTTGGYKGVAWDCVLLNFYDLIKDGLIEFIHFAAEDVEAGK